MNARAWTVCTDLDNPDAAILAREVGAHAFVSRVLLARGYGDPSRARAFLSPKLADLTRPDAMADRDLAAERLSRAIDRQEKIVVFGDYDVDGTTSAALLTLALRSMGADVTPLLASRFGGGYGLSDAALARVRERSPAVVVTCDCGTSDHPRLAELARAGVDAIVVDHHKVPEEALPAVAFLNPHRPDCAFPFKGLASVGLALSLAAAVRARRGVELDLRHFLDLVAVGTIADVAPLADDNRILTRAGMDRLCSGIGSPGLRALVREARLRGRMRALDVSFSIAPLMNAPGRLDSPVPTLDLLLAPTDAIASTCAQVLVSANERRRAVSADVLARAEAQVSDVYGSGSRAGIVVAGEGWHPGVGGIVAARLVDRFRVPVIVVALEGAEGVGSARAPRGFALFDAVKACAAALEQFGGHDGAAGMRVRSDRIEALRADFAAACARVAARVGPTDDATSSADTELSAGDLDEQLVAHLHTLEPTGAAHGEPLVVARGVKVGAVREAGTVHLRARGSLGRRPVTVFARDGVARRARGELDLREGPFDLLGQLRPDPFGGPDAVQLEVIDARPA